MRYNPGKILVKFRQEATTDQIDKLLTRHPVAIEKFMEYGRFGKFVCPEGREEEVCRKMSLEELVVFTKRSEKPST